MRAPGGPGEAPAVLLGGSKLLIFQWFLSGFHVFMHLASWLMLLALCCAGFL